MKTKQLSIFLENKSGRLTEVTEVLGKAGVNLSAMSIADNSDFGILRCIVSDPDKAKQELKSAGFPVSITDVLAVKADDRIGFLHDLLCRLEGNISSIEYMYTLPTEDGPVVVLKVANPEEIEKVLEGV